MDNEPALDLPKEFLPMPQEIYNEERSKNTVLLTDEQKKEAVSWLLSEGGVKLILAPKYDKDGRREQIIESLLLNGWFLPSLELANKIPLKATTGHHAASTSIPIEFDPNGSVRHKVDLVTKPMANPKKAEYEMGNLRKLSQNGIRAAQPFAVLSIEDKVGKQAYLLTLLERGVIPLQKIHFERFNPEYQHQQLRFFLRDLAGFLSQVHNEGIYHNDMHLGNIGYDLTQQHKNEFVLFDLEGAHVLSDHVKRRRDNLARKVIQKPKTLRDDEREEVKKFKGVEEEATKDLAYVAADILANNPKIPKDFIDRCLIAKYYKNRPLLEAYLPPTEFNKIFKGAMRKARQRFEKLSQRGIESSID